jgi:hypothetical protein
LNCTWTILCHGQNDTEHRILSHLQNYLYFLQATYTLFNRKFFLSLK